MSFKDDFVAYANKVQTPKEKIWLEFSEFQRIPFVIMGLIPHVHIKIPKEVLANLHENDKALYALLYDKCQYFAYTYFRASNKSLKQIRRNVYSKTVKCYEVEFKK